MGKGIESPNHSGANFVLWPSPWPSPLPTSVLVQKEHLSAFCVCVVHSVCKPRYMCVCSVHVHVFVHVVMGWGWKEKRRKVVRDLSVPLEAVLLTTADPVPVLLPAPCPFCLHTAFPWGVWLCREECGVRNTAETAQHAQKEVVFQTRVAAWFE